VFPPLVYAFQDDPEVRTLGGEKLVGDSLLVALVAKDGARTVDVYLPKGAAWIGYDDGKRYEGGQWVRKLPLYSRAPPDRAGVYRLPMFAREGAIIPVALVDDKTYNTLGKRADNVRHDELRFRVFASREPTSFTLVEDDGATMKYQQGELRKTLVTQRSEASPRTLDVMIDKAQGSYVGAPTKRGVVADIVLPAGVKPTKVSVDQVELRKLASCAKSDVGWCTLRAGEIRVTASELDSSARKIVVSW
jgi:alpha-glucosidase (family GH31 glycosyl hydrolase)